MKRKKKKNTIKRFRNEGNLEEETSEVRAQGENLVGSKLVLPFPHCFLLLHIFDEIDSHLKHLNNEGILQLERKQKKRRSIIMNIREKERPCSRRKCQSLEPRIERNVAKVGTERRAYLL